MSERGDTTAALMKVLTKPPLLEAVTHTVAPPASDKKPCACRDERGVLPLVCSRPKDHNFTHRMRPEQPTEWLAQFVAGRDAWRWYAESSALERVVVARQDNDSCWLAMAVTFRGKRFKPPAVVVPCGRSEQHRHDTEDAAITCASHTLTQVGLFLDALANSPEAKRVRDSRKRRAVSQGPGWDQLRKQVLAEEQACRTCGQPPDVVDHIVPLFRGGGQGRENLQALCSSCNAEKTRKDTSGSLELTWALRPPPFLRDPIDVRQIAARLGFHPRTSRRWQQSGKLPEPDFPGQYPWWEWSTIEAWAQETGRLRRE